VAGYWIMCFLPNAYVDYDLLTTDEYSSSPIAVLVFPFVTNTNFALYLGFQAISRADINSNGISMDRLLTETFDLGHIILSLYLSSIVTIMLSAYFERVSPTAKLKVEPAPRLYFFSVRASNLKAVLIFSVSRKGLLCLLDPVVEGTSSCTEGQGQSTH